LLNSNSPTTGIGHGNLTNLTRQAFTGASRIDEFYNNYNLQQFLNKIKITKINFIILVNHAIINYDLQILKLRYDLAMESLTVKLKVVLAARHDQSTSVGLAGWCNSWAHSRDFV